MPRAYQGAGTRTYQKLYGYKNLITWQKADDLATQVHEITIHGGLDTIVCRTKCEARQYQSHPTLRRDIVVYRWEITSASVRLPEAL